MNLKKGKLKGNLGLIFKWALILRPFLFLICLWGYFKLTWHGCFKRRCRSCPCF